MNKLSLLSLALALILVCAGCENMQQTLQAAAQIVEDNPGLVKDEQQRGKWVAGARAVKSWIGEIDVGEEIAMGQSLAVRAFANFGKPYPDRELQQYVAKVGMLVALQSERPAFHYSFAVVESDQPNALALPGGYIFVSTGLLTQLGSESELACVLGHEICHVAQKHGIEIVSRNQKITSLVDFGETLDERVGQYRQFIDLTYQRLATEGYDQRYEWIADQAGSRYAYRAGYNPEGLVPFLFKTAHSEQPVAFESYKTYPDPAVRLRKLKWSLGELGDYSALPRLEDRYRREALQKLQ
ncbi:MAG: M48 family metalloprotease [Planctomycetes bacterium]|nr:M48 family metalloprotease [Planctomycetota bacterium]